MSAFLTGFGTGLSLIVAIGAQNAFVLKAGILRQHVLAVVLFCAISDAILVAAGVWGLGRLLQSMPWLDPVMRYGGAAFLIIYAMKSFWSAWRGGQGISTNEFKVPRLGASLATVAAFTWLNPHVYLDTVVLLGAVAAQYDDKTAFAAGAIIASFVFFFSLGFGARGLAPSFAKPVTWRYLDAAIGCLMLVIATELLF